MQMPTMSGGRRPHASDNGPYTSWPPAIATRNSETVRLRACGEAANSFATAEKAGRYISVAKAANEVSAPSRMTVCAEGLFPPTADVLTESLRKIVISWS